MLRPKKMGPQASIPIAVGADPVDTVTDGSNLLRAARMMERIDKRGHAYRVAGQTALPDGGLFLGYRDGDGQGYAARVGADGAIAWEARADGLRGVGVDRGGRLHVVTDREDLQLDVDGTELARTALPRPLQSFWVDPRSGGLVGVADDRRLVMSGAPEVPAGDVVMGMRPGPDGDTAVVRTLGALLELNDHAILRAVPLPRETTPSNVWLSIDDAWPSPDGGAVCLVRKTIELSRPHFPMRGSDPAEPFPGTCSSAVTVRKLDRDGRQMWESRSLGETTRAAAGPEGSLFVSGDGDGGYPVSRVTPEGTLTLLATFSEPVAGLDVRDGQLLVRRGRNATAFDEAGGRTELRAPEGWTVRGWAPGSRVLLDNAGRTALALLPLEGGPLQIITDTENDHSPARGGEIERLARTLPGGKKAPEIIVEDGRIIVGGVRVPRKSVVATGSTGP